MTAILPKFAPMCACRGDTVLTFISGGCKNGKSWYAQRLAKAAGMPLYYVATMISTGAEDDARIARHIQDRDGWGFETLECGRNITECLNRADVNGSFLLDSVTALLANEMFAPEGFDADAPTRVAAQLENFAAHVGHAVFVSDFLYGDAAIYDEWTENYRRGLALVDRRLARICDNVLEVSAGCVICRKGVKLL